MVPMYGLPADGWKGPVLNDFVQVITIKDMTLIVPVQPPKNSEEEV